MAMTTPNDRDREVAELARNSGTRLERILLIAGYREEIEKAERERVLNEVEKASMGRPTVPWLHNVLLKLWGYGKESGT